MSGIVVILRHDGGRVDAASVERMAAVMRARAPDGCRAWTDSNIGLGHALLVISTSGKGRAQPCTLDGSVWITADVRLDGRAELIQSLRGAGRSVLKDASDAELILHTYAVFGSSFLDHLIGDFAFAIWDGRQKELIAARDHFGVRPLYYANQAGTLAIASDINALRTLGLISGTLDELAVADFLLFGKYLEPELTIYRDVRTLPPASTMWFGLDGLRIRRYWQLEHGIEYRFKKDSDYVDRFEELFSQAVTDRLGADRVALELSGGMDSTSIAAVAAAEAKISGRSLQAYTVTCDDIFPTDDETFFTKMVASHLSLSLQCDPIENYDLFERFDSTELVTDQPVPGANLAQRYDYFARLGQEGVRVLLSGQGGDAVLGHSNQHNVRLLRQHRYVRLLAEMFAHFRHAGTLAGMGLRSAFFSSSQGRPWKLSFPTWFNEDFVARNALQARWDHFWQLIHDAGSDSVLQMRFPWDSQFFQSKEALPLPVVVRYPFYDIRLVNFLQGVPTYVKKNKWVLRQAMKERLPMPVLKRPKTALGGDLVRSKLATGMTARSFGHFRAPHTSKYIDASSYLVSYNDYVLGSGADSTWSSVFLILPVAFDNWLHQQSKSR